MQFIGAKANSLSAPRRERREVHK